MPHDRKIVLIMTDQQRWDMCGCYRDTGLKTPCIDSLSGDGVRFERAYTTQPVCQPARAGIFTGMYPHSCAGWSNSMGLSDNALTLGQRLSDNGIATAYIGKWHLDGGDYFGCGKCPDGWNSEYWYDMRTYLEELSPEQRLASRNVYSDFPAELTFGRRCSDRAIDFLARHGSEDFFLTVSYDEPHDPFICPNPYSEMYKDFAFPKSPNVYDTLDDKPDSQRVWAGEALRADKDALVIGNRFYFGCNTFVDSEIGRVVAAVNRHAPGALTIYTSDHGDMLHSHSICGKGPAAYDEITRVPLIFTGAGVKRGAVCKHPVSHINIAPTVMEWMGFPIPKTMEGASIASALSDPEIRINDHVFMEFGRYEVDHDGFGGFQPMRSIFDGRFKLTVNLLSSDELYDLGTDPHEMVNLIYAPAFIPVRNGMHDALLSHMDRTRDPFRGYHWERRPWRDDARAATWAYTNMTRQREEDERYEKRQFDYLTGMEMEHAVRAK